jgi:D-xylose transport system permease protein
MSLPPSGSRASGTDLVNERTASTAGAPPPGGEPPGVVPDVDSFSSYTRAWLRQLRSGESGVLPVVAGLIVLGIIFQIEDATFLSASNLTNLLNQASYLMLFAMAELFVLLLGEIDLSLGYEGAIGAAIMCWLATTPVNQTWWVAVLAGLGATTVLGLTQGLLITRIGLPSFVVTLAGFLGFAGLELYIILNVPAGNGGTISITNSVINDFVNGNLSVAATWIVTAAIVAVFAVLTLNRDRGRRQTGLKAPPLSVSILKIVLVAAGGAIVAGVTTANRGRTGLSVLEGMPWDVLIVLGVCAAWSFLLGRTRYGRYVYAIGGNAEAARRAGINLRRIRTIAFGLAGLTAGAAGILYASELGSISTNVEPNLVLYAVAGAVVGGTSLVGGRGKMSYALLGGFVIATIYNGMVLLGLSAAAQEMVTALVLLAAVTLDAFTRRKSSLTAR